MNLISKPMENCTIIKRSDVFKCVRLNSIAAITCDSDIFAIKMG